MSLIISAHLEMNGREEHYSHRVGSEVLRSKFSFVVKSTLEFCDVMLC